VCAISACRSLSAHVEVTMASRLGLVVLVTSAFGCASVSSLSGCGPVPERSELRESVERSNADAGDGAPPAAVADEVEIVRGVPDKNRDPAVVAIGIGDDGLCTGTLISSRLVLTARHCVSRTVKGISCPASGVQVLGSLDPSSLTIYIGDDWNSAHRVARGIAVVAPSGVTICEADIAIIILDTDVKQAKALAVRSRGAAYGERVRAVGFGRRGDDEEPGTKLVREHVRVLSVTPSEFTVGEATCQGDSGGPALDQTTGEVVGVISRGGPTCEGPGVHNIYTRVDAFTWLVDEAFAKVAGLARNGDSDAGAPGPPPARGTKQKPPSDVGGPCERASDCAAGVCITSGEAKYCSRPCGTGDRCPTHYHCESVSGTAGGRACIAVP